MTHPIPVVLVTGFLGSGKTTFLNHVIAAFPGDLRVAVLMNEFADIGIDAALLRPRRGMAVVEVNKGSIFCICAKKDFLLGLARVADRIAPDLLLIEATGVANPLDIRKDLALDIFRGRFAFLCQVCLVDTVNFEAAYHVYNAVESQIASSDLFVLNKLDLADSMQVETARGLIAAHKAGPVFVEADHGRIPLDDMVEQVRGGRRKSAGAPGPETLVPRSVEQTVAGMTGGGMAPADGLVAAVFRWKGRTRAEAEHFFNSLPASVLRAKGFIRVDGETRLGSRVMENWRLDPPPGSAGTIPPAMENRIALIAPAEAIEAIANGAVSRLLERESTHDPVAILDMMPPTVG